MPFGPSGDFSGSGNLGEESEQHDSEQGGAGMRSALFRAGIGNLLETLGEEWERIGSGWERGHRNLRVKGKKDEMNTVATKKEATC
jgi:hypothetical protein